MFWETSSSEICPIDVDQIDSMYVQEEEDDIIKLVSSSKTTKLQNNLMFRFWIELSARMSCVIVIEMGKCDMLQEFIIFLLSNQHIESNKRFIKRTLRSRG